MWILNRGFPGQYCPTRERDEKKDDDFEDIQSLTLIRWTLAESNQHLCTHVHDPYTQFWSKTED